MRATFDRHGRRADNLVLVGETGVGKSSLLAAAATMAGHRTVMTCAGTQAESGMPYAGLHQLLYPLLSEIDRLPLPQANALRVVFGLVDGFYGRLTLPIALATVNLLTGTAARCGLVVLVDDIDQLDEPSRNVVLFALRRLRHANAVIIVAARAGSFLEDAGLPMLRVGPLAENHARDLLYTIAGPVSASVAQSLVAVTRGNPLALAELATHLPRRLLNGAAPLPEWLPCTERLRRAFGVGQHDLPVETRALLLLAAANDGVDLQPVLAAGRLLGVERSALGPAERAGLLTESGGELWFRHGITRSVIYSETESAERQAAHGALAEVLTEQPHRVAWHRSYAGEQADDRIAATLAEAAIANPSQASKWLRRAIECGTDARVRDDYQVRAASHAVRAGQAKQALALLAPVATTEDSVLSARIALLRAQLMHTTQSADATCGRLLAAADLVGAAEPQLVASLLAAATHSALVAGDTVLMDGIVTRVQALGLAREHWLTLLGATLDRVRARDLRVPDGALAHTVGGMPTRFPDVEPLAWPPVLLPYLIGFDDEAYDRHAARLAGQRAPHTTGIVPTASIPVVEMDHLAGRWSEAVAIGERALLVADQTGQPVAGAQLRVLLALIAAARGDIEGCRDLVEQAWRVALPSRITSAVALGQWALGLAELGRGKPERAIQHLQEVVTRGRKGHHFMVALAVVPDLVEAHVRLGDLAGARRSLRIAEEWTTGHPMAPSSRALLRARALVAPDDETRTELFDAAVAAAGRSPFDLARAELAYGEWLRRERHIQQARFRLNAALAGFTMLGALPWAEHARAELRASGEITGTHSKPRPSLLRSLSPQEERIARLAAGGMTNPEIGARLFLSPRTVRYHLSKVFPKLNITSRHQLRDLGLADATSE